MRTAGQTHIQAVGASQLGKPLHGASAPDFSVARCEDLGEGCQHSFTTCSRSQLRSQCQPCRARGKCASRDGCQLSEMLRAASQHQQA